MENEKRNISLEKAGRMFTAMNGSWDESNEITFGDIEGLTPAETFESFIELNADKVNFYEEGAL